LKTLRVYPDGSRKGGGYAPVVLDFKGSVIKLYQVCGNEHGYVVELPMPKWVVDRLSEGGDVKYAMIGLKNNEPYLALIAEREVEPYIPSDYMLAIDVNAWNNGIAWGLVKGNRISSFKQEGLNVGKIVGLYKQAIKRERKLGALKRLGLGDTVNAKRAGRLVKRLRSRAIQAH
jgi:hypothetical protein